jgi:hypothetical protein
MTTTIIEKLELEIHRLRNLVNSLSATLLRNIELDPPKYRRNASKVDAERLLQEADECFRCATVPGLKKEIADGLEAAGNELAAKAAEIETAPQREKWKK